MGTGQIHGAESLEKGQALGGVMSAKASTSLCRVQLRLRPTPNSDIRAEAWLPYTWNGKLLSYGGGGFSGGIAQSEGLMNASSAQGYATATSDLGHAVSATARWAHRQPDKVDDFGHRANHEIAFAVKQLIEIFYKAPVRHAYFQGCSGGGREALMEVSRYPEDYDGVIAGSPAMNFGEIMAQMIWNSQILATAPTLHTKLPAVHQAVLQACDRLDGVDDGVLENPTQCRFDPAVLRCKVFDTAACLNAAELSALRKLYDGPRLATGEHLIAGPALGSEGAGWVMSSIMTSIGGPEYYRWLVHGDPRWDATRFDLDRDYPLARSRTGHITDSSSGDIDAFVQRGGKLILYHGWADTLISAHNTVRYHETVRNKLGPRTDDSVRLFMAPGMPHCGEGADMLQALEDWVERGQAPQRVILATRTSSWVGTRAATHPLCPWPQAARYNGQGSTRDADNFTCVQQP
ncbi:hypothetical protein A4W93_06510 [Piscinibacter gummiphilus]|uniref:Feruloyl esterase n=1 Tax=Piscinibacter gummiphilus TaxID=946333 RepID=A0A1W6L5Q7_9BURK|nr:hypothetical protein A4W93_06510 [Piscinibacter gummiphilus]